MADGADRRGMPADLSALFLGGGLLAGSASSRLGSMAEGLKETADDTEQMVALSELGGYLIQQTEETMQGFRLDTFVPLLVMCMRKEYNPEIMHLACKAVYSLLDVLPGSAGPIIGAGALPVLVQRLHSVEAIDVAEQAIHCLEKLAAEFPSAVLREGAMPAMLMYVDFHNITMQRKVAATVVHMSKRASAASFDTIQESLPPLSNFLCHDDPKMVESGCHIFARLVQCFVADEEKLLQVASETLLLGLMSLLKRDSPQLTPHTPTLVLRTLSAVAKGSVVLTGAILDCDAFEELLQLFRQSKPVAEGTPGFSLDSSPPGAAAAEPVEHRRVSSRRCMPTETISEAVQLLENALPSVTDGVLATLGKQHGEAQSDPQPAARPQPADLSEGTDEDEEAEERDGEDEQMAEPTAAAGRPQPGDLQRQRVALFSGRPELSRRLLSSMADVMDIHANTVHRHIKSKCLSVWMRLLHFAPPDQLQRCLRDIPVSSFITQLMHAGDPHSTAAGLHAADTLMRRLPAVFGVYFAREGVVAELQRLCEGTSPELEAVRKVGQRVQQEHFADRGDAGTHPVARALSELAVSAGAASSADEVLRPLCDMLSAADGVSVYEFATTGIVDGLLQFLRAEGETRERRLSRAYDAFRILSQPMPPPPPDAAFGSPSVRSADSSGASTYFVAVVRKLVCALHQSERLPVYVTGDRGRDGRRDKHSGHRLLTQAFRLKLVCMAEKPKVRDTTVMIEPLATIGAVAEFIKQKLVHPAGEEERHRWHGCPLQDQTTRHGGWDCDGCGKSNRGPGPRRWRCDSCDYDLCEVCMASKEQRPPGRQPSDSAAGAKGGSARRPSAEAEKQGRGERRGLSFFSRRRESKRREAAAATPGGGGGGGGLERTSSSSSGAPSAAASERQSSTTSWDGTGDMTVEVLINSHVMPASLSIFQAIHRYSDWCGKPSGEDLDTPSAEMVHTTRAMWDALHTVQFRFVAGERPSSPVAAAAHEESAAAQCGADAFSAVSLARSNPGDSEGTLAVSQALAGSAQVVSGFDAHLSARAQSILCLLNILFAINQNARALRKWASPAAAAGSPGRGEDVCVCDSEFVSSKLTNKVMRQVMDGLLLCTGHLRNSWCQPLLTACPQLFSLHTRLTFFELASFGPIRTMQRLQELLQEQGEDCRLRLGGPPRKQKVKIGRSSVLECARKAMDMYSSLKHVLEFEFYGEVGTGQGPTHEFYTLSSRELQLRSLALWHDDGDDEFEDSPSEYVNAPRGLFPRPHVPGSKQHESAIGYFKFAGQLMGRAVYDRRLIDLPLSRPMLKLLQGRQLGIGDLVHIAPGLYETLLQFMALAEKRDKILERLRCALRNPSPDAAAEVGALKFTPASKPEAECSVEDLCLEFTLPGFDSIPMRDDGGSTDAVTIWNVHEYVDLTVEWMLKRGIEDQVRAMWQGANGVFPTRQLRLFPPDELEELMCGCGDVLTLDALQEATVCNHGYSQTSRAVRFLFEILSEFTPSEVRQFLVFCTGAPRLPVGGLKALRPRLTVVRKSVESGGVHESLPSVMTCQNYLKLPDYTSREQMEWKLRQAITEGAESFHLS